MTISGAVYREGVAYTPDGAVYVQHTEGATIDDPTITGTVTNGGIILAQSVANVTAPEDTNENTLATITIPAGAMGVNGRLRFRFAGTQTGNGNKVTRIKFGATQIFTATRTTTTSQDVIGEIVNENAANAQRAGGFIEITSGAITSGVQATATIDTASATTLTFTMQKGTGTDAFVLEWYYVELWKVD